LRRESFALRALQGAHGDAFSLLLALLKNFLLGSNRMLRQIRAGRFRRRPQKLGLVIFLIGLLSVTGWNVTRSSAVIEARRAYLRGDLAVGLALALDHLDRQPWSGEAALLAANCLSRLDYSGQAEAYYRRAGNLGLNAAQVRAYALARGPQPELAIPAYNEILARSPENVSAMRRLAAVLLAQNGGEELLKLAERLEQISGGAVIGSTLRGVVYHNDKIPQQAAAAFERVLELDPELREMPLPRNLFWSQLADDLVSSGRIDDARHYLTKALSNAPDASLLNILGQTYFLQGMLDEANRCFREAAELATTDHLAYMNLARVAIQRHEQEEALKQLNRARGLAPRRYSVLYTLASVYRQLGRKAEANQVEESLEQLREQPTSQATVTNASWPSYSL
jgi:tetratricopeptide (TPR) repeat protein